jgi:hypothetical protein
VLFVNVSKQRQACGLLPCEMPSTSPAKIRIHSNLPSALSNKKSYIINFLTKLPVVILYKLKSVV